MKIPLLNLYHMLCYAWDRLPEAGHIRVEQLDKRDAAHLFASALVEGIKHLLKKGLDRGYVPCCDQISVLRGKIDFADNLKRHFFYHPRWFCHFDEFSNDVLHNRIIKATLSRLLGLAYLDPTLKNEIKEILLLTHSISDTVLSASVFRQVQLYRNNGFYDFLLNICRLIYDNVLISPQGGDRYFIEYLQDTMTMSRIFENFVRNFYRRHLTGYTVSRSYIDWRLKPLDGDAADRLPKMETDITLRSSHRKIIIDTKWYQQTLSVNEKIISEHLYQLFAYLKNQENPKDPTSLRCAGMLLYPTVDKQIHWVYHTDDAKHLIIIRTIHLNQQWFEIEKDLLDFVAESAAD